MERVPATWTDGRFDPQTDENCRRLDLLRRRVLQMGGGIIAINLATIVWVIATRA
jgi:hypothetical protein